MNPAKHFHVLIGAPTLADHLPEGPCVVIDADEGCLQRLRGDLDQFPHHHPCVLLCAAVSAESSQPLQWFSYNDARFDGILSPELRSRSVPNLICLQQQTLNGRTLADLLDQAVLPIEEYQTGHLVLRQGDPMAVLSSAGSWMDTLQIVELAGPDLPDCWGGIAGRYLEPLGFRLQQAGQVWQRPSTQMLRLLLEKLQDQREQLVVERDDQMNGRRQLAERLDQQSTDHRDELAQLRETMHEQIASINLSREQVIVERDELKQHLSNLEAMHEQVLLEHRREWDQERQRWQEREAEWNRQLRQEELMAGASAAQMNLLTDLVARWLADQSDQ